MSVSITTSSIAQFLRISKHEGISFDGNQLFIRFENNPQLAINIEEIDSFDTSTGWIWSQFIIVLKDGTTHQIKGIANKEIKAFSDNFEKHFINYFYTYQYLKALPIQKMYPSDTSYFQKSDLAVLKAFVAEHMHTFRFLSKKPSDPLHKELLETVETLKQPGTYLQEMHNAHFINQELLTYKSFFDTVEKMPLTDKQREAVIINEKANLIIAGAGSGKTSVMVARVGYIIKKYGIKPEEILLLAFNKSAANELQERIKERLNIEGVKAATFHALGLEIIGKASGTKASPASWAGSETEKALFVQGLIAEIAQRDRSFERKLMTFFAYPFSAYKSAFDFKTELQYRRYVYENKIVTLKGEQVKSYEECEIANFLFLNGVDYRYEAFYEHATATEKSTQYQPDFYLVESGIYLEHFGINEKGETAPYIDNTHYLESMVWKRALHRHYGTLMLETYSYEQRRGCLLEKLRDKLIRAGVVFKSLSFAEALQQLSESSSVNNFSKTVATFIAHFKSNDHTISTIKSRAKGDERLVAFVELIEPVLHAYEITKQHQKVIDFEDMIIMATRFVEEKQFDSRYKCILVDEFQDISVARARLVKALHQSDSKNLLTVVGDDWQSIYRFAGSDISLFHKFGEYFGDYESVTLDYTFRFNDKISQVSQQFIEQNPNQIKKNISTIKQAKDEKVHVWIGDNKSLLQIESLLKSFAQDNVGESFSVYILGRTRFAFPQGISTVKSKFPMAKITTSTAHSSKGLEADYVIITGIESGPFGFPSTIADDPLLDIVLAEQEAFEFAEERRLFYVALTRAKKEVHILSSDQSISPFIKELEKVNLVMFHYIDDVKMQACPECNTGTLVLRNSKYGSFYGCSNFVKFGCAYKRKM